jgi:GAF domain-containing protein
MENRKARERAVLQVIEQSKLDSLDSALDKMTAALHDNFPDYTGVYLYLLKGETLELGHYSGRPTEHTRISIGAGICGRAARVKQTVVIDDVNADTEYIACSLETRSEIVVPIMRGDRVLGEIDIDSDVSAAFSDADREFLEKVAQLIEPMFGTRETSNWREN